MDPAIPGIFPVGSGGHLGSHDISFSPAHEVNTGEISGEMFFPLTALCRPHHGGEVATGRGAGQQAKLLAHLPLKEDTWTTLPQKLTTFNHSALQKRPLPMSFPKFFRRLPHPYEIKDILISQIPMLCPAVQNSVPRGLRHWKIRF